MSELKRLILTRRPLEAVLIRVPGRAPIRVVSLDRRCRLAIEAEADVSIVREELTRPPRRAA